MIVSAGFLWVMYVTVFVSFECISKISSSGGLFHAVELSGILGTLPGILVGVFCPHSYVLSIASQVHRGEM
jgi:hypothetical protein